MLQSLFDTLFGCSHQRTTFPLTPARKAAGHLPSAPQRIGTYVTCLDCGREFAYDWKAMRIGQPVLNRVPAVTTQPSFR
jgi:hypothetical protein